jgi:hypothetical protein
MYQPNSCLLRVAVAIFSLYANAKLNVRAMWVDRRQERFWTCSLIKRGEHAERKRMILIGRKNNCHSALHTEEFYSSGTRIIILVPYADSYTSSGYSSCDRFIVCQCEFECESSELTVYRYVS